MEDLIKESHYFKDGLIHLSFECAFCNLKSDSLGDIIACVEKHLERGE